MKSSGTIRTKILKSLNIQKFFSVLFISIFISGCSLSASIESGLESLLEKDSFRVVPASADITENGVLTLTGENGEPPYFFEKVSGSGVVSSSGAFAAASTGPGEAVTVKATDKNGKIAFAVFNIVKAPEVLPKTQTLAVLNKFKFSVSGGKAPYTFSVKAGGGSITPAGEYTAPASNGSVTIEVVDALGGKGEGYITVVDALQFTTPTVTMATNAAETFGTTGGVPPVVMSLESGLGSFDPVTKIYSSSGVSGTATLVAHDALGNEARSQITINSSLLINPPLIELVINSIHTFTATGGVPPYTYSLVSGSGAVTTAGVYTAPAAIGTAKVRVTDSKGATSDSSVNINPELSFIFPNISLLVNETKNLSLNVIGGAPPLTYSVSPGAGTINSSTGVFVAGSSPGVYTATVVDSKGYTAQASITVQPPMAITPVNATIMAGTDLSYSASGGTGPYTFSVATGGGSFVGSIYTASASAGSATVRATDSLGNFVTTNVTIVPIIQITPATLTMVISGTQTFTAAGGIPPYTFKILSGAGTIDSSSGLFTASATEGTAIVEVVDSQSNHAQSSVTILDQVRIVPSPLSMVKKSTHTVLATGGLGPYSFSIVTGAGTINSSSGLFESADQAGSVTVKATDSLGNSGTGTIIVYDSLTIDNAPDAIMVGEVITLAASGGATPYVYSVTNGSSSGSIDPGTGVLTASMTPGMVTVRVADSLGQTYDKTIEVRAALTIVPTTATLAPANTFQFSATGGVGAYTFAMVSGAGSISTSGLYTAAASAGSAVVKVTDAGGRTANATITINAVLTLTPALSNIKYSDTQSLTAAGGVTPYTYSKISGPGSINVSTGLFTADTTAGTSVLRVTDALGNYAEASVVTHAPVEITPATKDLAFAEVFSFTALKGLPPYTFSIVSGGGSINAVSGSFAAPSVAGTTTIRVTDSLSQTATAVVTTYEALLISPLAASIATSQTQNISATGGVPPYTFSLMTGTGSVQAGPDRYVAAATATTAKVKVTDNVGNFSIGTINVVGPVSISPTTLTLAVNETRTFSGLGGSTPYTFSVQSGGGSINTSTGAYTAPGTTGSATVRITDALSQTADATVTIIAGLALSPATATLAVGNQQQFTPAGGVGPYTYDVQSGSGTVNSSGLFTAGGSAGSAVVRVTDSEGRTATANVTINGALAISPTTAELIFAGTQTFTASGGLGPYSYTVVVPGTGSVGVSTGAYVAPSLAGTESVRVTDSLGNTSTAVVTIIGPVQISPTTKSLVVGDSFTFTASGGKTPYGYSVSSGGGSITSGGVYTASNTVGSYTVRVTDALGQHSDSTVTLTASVSLSPATATLSIGNQQQFTASNGTGPYTYDIQSGLGSVNSSGLFTAGGSSGTTVVRVTDSGGRTATSTVTVNGAIAISPTTKDLIFAGTQTFTASGGVGPYTYIVVGPGTGTVGSSTGAYTAPSVAGTETVRVTDSLGNSANATVTVFGPVQISPTTKTMAVGESFTFTASGGKTAYSYGVSSGGGTITSGGAYTAGATTGSYTIRVTDALGQHADAVVTLTPAIDLAPDTNSIRIGQTQVLTRTGGTGPFTYTVVSGGGTFDDGTLTYTPPNSLTTATVRVTDSASNTDQVTITVTAGVPAAVAYVTSAQTVQAGTCSGVTTVKLQDAYGNDTTATASTTVGFAATNLTFYSDASCSSVVTSQVIASGASQASVYFKGTVTGLQIATASSSGLSSSTQTESITGATETGLALSPNTLSVVAGACSSVSQLRAIDSFGNPTTPSTTRSVTLAGTGVSFFSDASCSSALSIPVSLTSGSATQDVYFKKTTIGATTVTASASGITSGTLTLTVTAATASKLAYITQPSSTAGSGAALLTQPVVGVYDQYDNLVNTATNAVTISLSSSNTCSSSVGGLTATTNPRSASAGSATFAGATISSVGDFYIKAESSGLTAACSSMVSVTVDYSQTLAKLPGFIPHDGLAEAPIFIVPKIGSADLGTAKVIEVTSSSGNVTMTCNGSACSACQIAAATCVRAYDYGQGAYAVNVKSSTAESVTFTVRYNDGGALSTLATLPTVFNTANFTTVSTTTAITNATHAGLNLYFTAGTATFDATTVGRTFGVMFVRGGTLTYTAPTTTAVYKFDINAAALVMQSGTIEATGLGFVTTRGWSSTGPSTDLYNAYSPHGGIPATGTSYVYGDYRDPQYAGSGGFTHNGGGVVRINSAGACAINGTSKISVNSAGVAAFNYGAGGSIKLQCAGILGNAAASSLVALGGTAGGGGGRIALISTGTEASFAGSFAWPKDNTKMTTLVDRVRTNGATNSGSSSGNGTLYVKHSGLTYGGLIVHNAGITLSGRTVLLSLYKIAGMVAGQVLPFTVALPTGSTDILKGLRLRPDIAATNGTPANLLDDNIVTVDSNTLNSMTVTGSLAGVAPGAVMRSIDVLDYLFVGGGAILTSESDIVVLSGNFVGANLSYTNGIIENKSGSVTYPAVEDITLSTGTSMTLSDILPFKNLTLSGATVVYPGVLGVLNDFTFSSGTATLATVNVGRNFAMSGGTLTHAAIGYTGPNLKIEMSVGDSFSLTGGTIDLVMKGYYGTYSYSNTGPALALGSAGNSLGASHGGRGANTTGSINPTYGDFRDPQYAGASAFGSNNGGGVFRLTATNSCTINSGAKIDANGNFASAGGSIKMVCGSFAGTLGAASIVANGTGVDSNKVSAGGGRIALISTGNEASFGGNFAWPSDATKMTNFLSRIQAKGGSAAGYVGGAGTIYIKHSGQTYGSLIISNGGNAGGSTDLPWLSATTGTVAGQTLPFTAALPTGYNDLYVGRMLRTDLSQDNATPTNLLDDNIVTITANALNNMTVSGSLAAVGSGATFRTLEVLDSIAVGEGANLRTGSDVVVLNGTLTNSSSLAFTNGTFEMIGSAKVYPSTPTVTLTSGSFTGTNFSGGDVTVNGATVNYTGAMTMNNFTLTTGTVTSAAGSLTTGNLNLNGGTYNVATTNVTGNMAITGSGTNTFTIANITNNLTIGGGTNTSTTVNVGNDLTINSGTNNFITSNVTRDVIMAGGTNEMDNATITRDFKMSNGTLKHRVATTTAAYRLNWIIQGLFEMTGGSINVTSLGYRAATGSGYSYGFGSTAPSNAAGIGSNVNNASYAAGGSHGGKGGTSNGGSILSGITYGDYRNPRYPGGGGAIGGNGGGVVNLKATGSCTVNSPATIKADGTALTGGAGGSIKLDCGSFAGTVGSAGITANGGTGDGSFKAGGGGGRIALISSGNSSTFAGNFAIPNNSTVMTSFTGVVQARGGNSAATAGYRGGAGTIYLYYLGGSEGELIVHNGGVSGSATDMVGSVANSSIINSKVDDMTLKVTASGTPFANMVDLFVGAYLHVWENGVSGAEDPGTETPARIVANTTNNFVVAANNYVGVAMANDHQYRMVHFLNRLYVGGSATLNMAGSDVIIEGQSGTGGCDFVSAAGVFTVAAGSSITSGNSYSSFSCPDTSMSTKGSTINFTRYCDTFGTCNP